MQEIDATAVVPVWLVCVHIGCRQREGSRRDLTLCRADLNGKEIDQLSVVDVATTSQERIAEREQPSGAHDLEIVNVENGPWPRIHPSDKRLGQCGHPTPWVFISDRWSRRIESRPDHRPGLLEHAAAISPLRVRLPR